MSQRQISPKYIRVSIAKNPGEFYAKFRPACLWFKAVWNKCLPEQFHLNFPGISKIVSLYSRIFVNHELSLISRLLLVHFGC